MGVRDAKWKDSVLGNAFWIGSGHIGSHIEMIPSVTSTELQIAVAVIGANRHPGNKSVMKNLGY